MTNDINTDSTDARLSPAGRFFRAARNAAILQLLGEYDEYTEDRYDITRREWFRTGATAERVDAVDDLAFRAAQDHVRGLS